MGSKHYSLPYIRICSRKERKCNKVMYWLFTIKLQIATNLRIWKKVSHRLPVCLKGGGGVSDLCCGQTDRQTRLQYFSFLCLHWGMLHSLLSLPGWRYGRTEESSAAAVTHFKFSGSDSNSCEWSSSLCCVAAQAARPPHTPPGQAVTGQTRACCFIFWIPLSSGHYVKMPTLASACKTYAVQPSHAVNHLVWTLTLWLSWPAINIS